MKTIRTTILLILCVALGVGYLVVKVINEDKKDLFQEFIQAEVLFPLPIQDRINYLSFERLGEKTIRMQLVKEDWFMSEPTETICDAATVGSILTSLRYGKKGKGFLSQDTGAAYGFDEPLFKLVVGSTVSRAHHTLIVGQKLKLRDLYYAKWDGSTQVFYLTEDLKKSLDKSVDSLRRRGVFSFVPRDVKSIRIAHSGRYFDLVRSENGWGFNPNSIFKNEKVNSEEVEAYIKFLRSVSIAQYVDGEDWTSDKWGLKNKRQYVRLSFYNQKPQTVYLGYASRELTGLYIHIDQKVPLAMIHSRFSKHLNRKAEDFYDRRLWMESLGGINRVDIKHNEQINSFEKIENQWWENEDSLNPEALTWLQNLMHTFEELKYVSQEKKEKWDVLNEMDPIFLKLKTKDSFVFEAKLTGKEKKSEGYVKSGSHDDLNDVKILRLAPKDVLILLDIISHLGVSYDSE